VSVHQQIDDAPGGATGLPGALGAEPARPRRGFSRRRLVAAIAAAAVAGAVVALVVPSPATHHAAAHSRTTARQAVAAGTPRKGELASTKPVAEARDPEEAKSFPVSGSVHHASAATPAKVAEEFVAPGAQSNAEVRAELAHMHAIESAARKQASATVATVPGGDSVGGNGTIPIPVGIPEVVQRVIAGANAITDFPYVYGGGHASFVSNSYDCSGSVSYALAAGGLLSAPETSGQLESWGEAGPGKWITIYANAGHVYMYVNVGGRWMRFDTVGRSGPYASRWQPEIRSNAGFVARHPPGF
jgi:cell wall-associated NlpC family hydrolase